MNRAQLKAAAKQQIKGYIGILFIITLAGAAATLFANVIPVVGTLASTFVITPAFTLGMILIYLDLTENRAPQFERLLDGFRDFWSAFKVTFFIGLFTVLWSMLFVIPGIVKGLSYSMAMLILAENKGMPALEAIDRSKKMMDGHKMELFFLMLSFIGWILLSYLTLGIALVWVAPYMGATLANFYQSLKPKAIMDTAADEDEPDSFEKAPGLQTVSGAPMLEGEAAITDAVPAKIVEEAPAKIVEEVQDETETAADNDFFANDFTKITF